MKTIVLRIDKSQGIAKALWDDAIEPMLRGLGTMSVTRASHVEFYDFDQTWYVARPDGVKVASGFKTRNEALAWESAWASGRILRPSMDE